MVGALGERVEPSWFVVLHYREPTYGLRPERRERDIGLEDVKPVVDEVIRLGGQVVRIGQPGMHPLRERERLIDFSEQPFLMQACAVSRARFFLELTPSGPASLASAFGTPRLRTNSVNLEGPLDDRGIVVPQRVVDNQGNDVTERALQKDFLNERTVEKMPGLAFRKNSLDQVFEAVSLMVDKTARTGGWRIPDVPRLANPPGRLLWPVPMRYRHKILV